MRNILIQCLSVGFFGCLSWRVELESGIGDLRTQCGKSETAITCHLARI